jgi:HK97 family phage prohead protease
MPRPLNIPDSYDVRAFHEVRVDSDLGTFDGHASAFWSVDSYNTAFAPKAFRETLGKKGDRIPVLFFHDPTEMVGPALQLKEDKTGLFHHSKVIEDGRTGSYVLAHLRGGTPMGMSFGFERRKDRAATEGDPIDLSTADVGVTPSDVRVITEVELFEISVLPWTFASQPKADVSNIRASVQFDAVQSLLDDLRAGRLTEERRNVIAELVAAWGEAAGAGPAHSTDAEARQTDLVLTDDDRAAALEILLAGSGLTPEQLRCVA